MRHTSPYALTYRTTLYTFDETQRYQLCHYDVVVAQLVALGFITLYQNRTEQLGKLGKLHCYYLDKFNQNGVFICHKQKCEAALQSGPRSEGVAPSRSVLVPGNCSTTA